MHTLVGTAMFELLWEALENCIVEESADLETIGQLDMIIEELLEILVSGDKERGAQVCKSNEGSDCIRKIIQILGRIHADRV